MRRGKTAVVGILSLALTAAPRLAMAEPPAGVVDWSGFYAGVQLGGGLDLVDVKDPFGNSIYGDTARTSGALAGLQAGYNWQWQGLVLGLEADAAGAGMKGTETCFAFSGLYLSANCRASVDALGTLTGRIGAALGPSGTTLVYGKAGAAWAYTTANAMPNGGFFFPATETSGVQWGWTLGAGAEQVLDAKWSVRAGYDFMSFANAGLTAPASGIAIAPNVGVPFPSAPTQFSQDFQTFKLGLNYRFGNGLAPPVDPILAGGVHGLEAEVGARYVAGWGRFQKDLGIQGQGETSLASRLTYDHMTTSGGELFGRVDFPFNVMVKAMIGSGSGGGQLNDEDWGLPFAVFVPYSNTISDVGNQINYLTADVGYDFWRTPGYKVAGFIGYSLFNQDMTGFGCTQIANANSDCVPPIPISVAGITETDHWQGIRLGAAADLVVAPGLKLTGEAAYLPYVTFSGTDDHVLRTLVSPEFGDGDGVELEGILSYALTDCMSVGVGARYWSMWTTNGQVDFGGTGVLVPMRYAAEQAAVFVQGSYAFGSVF